MMVSKRQREQALAASRRRERAERHEALMAEHAERRRRRERYEADLAEQIECWEWAFEEWQKMPYGPKPIHPLEVGYAERA